MTYYGRWTYKFEEAARKGAKAAIIIHDTPGASYGWDVVESSWSGPQYDLRAADDPAPRLPAQGWITGDAAQQLFADAGLEDRKSVVSGTSVSVRVDLGGRRVLKKKSQSHHKTHNIRPK